ncbi:MAG: ABC transporter transmembrane domain-containing protein, partial [Porcipelethomonas sp.]
MKKSVLKWLSNVTGKKKIYIVILLVIQSVLGISSVIYALLLRNIIDAAVQKDEKYFFVFLLLLIGLVLFQTGMRAVVRFLEEYSRSTFENIIKYRLFSNLLRKSYGSVTAVHSGEWLNRLTSDTVVIANGLVEIIPGIAAMAVKMTGALVTILVLEPKLAYILFPGGIALIFLTYGFRKRLKGLHKKIQEADGRLRVFMQERLGGLMIVRSFAAQGRVQKECSEKMAEHKAVRMKRNHFSNICNIGFAAAMNGMYLIGVCYFGYGMMTGVVSYGTLMAVLQLINQIQAPFANISGYLPRIYAVTASAERIMEVESFEDDCFGEVRTKAAIQEFYEKRMQGIGFENAGFTYLAPDQTSDKTNMPVVLKNISIEIDKGQYIAFTGHSGCGKSTLLKLMMCLYSLDEG